MRFKCSTPLGINNEFIYSSLYKRLSAFILKLKSSDLMNNDYAWADFLQYSIDERFNVAEQLLEFRSIKVHNGIAKKRIDEIEQHRNLLERHIKVMLLNIKYISSHFY